MNHNVATSPEQSFTPYLETNFFVLRIDAWYSVAQDVIGGWPGVSVHVRIKKI
jgi:hypothetical protein